MWVATAAAPVNAQPVASDPPPAWQSRDVAAVPTTTVQFDLSPRTHVVYEARAWRPLAPGRVDATAPTPRSSLGIGFRRQSGADGLKGLLRVQLDGGGALHFRPRGGGLNVTYRSQF